MRLTNSSLPLIGRALLAALALAFAGTGLQASGTRYYVNDHLATTVGIADAAGEIAALEADAFGSPLAAAEAPSRYTGKPYDEDMGAFVFPFRNYRAEEGRWMTGDPSGFPDGTNARFYAPRSFTALDPWGLSSYKFKGSNGSIYSHSWGPESIPVGMSWEGGFSISVSGFTDGYASSLTLSIYSQSNLGGINYLSTNASGSISLSINAQSGDVSVTGSSYDYSNDGSWAMGAITSVFEFNEVNDQSTVYKAKVNFGSAYASGSSSGVGFDYGGINGGITFSEATREKAKGWSFSIQKAQE